jgi:hypothetical protein
MSLEAVLARLQGVRRNGEQWVARCPAHADKNPSLSMREENGKVLLHCFAGCTVEAICDALEIKLSELFARPREVLKPEPRIVRETRRRITGLRSRLTPSDRERAVTVVFADETNLDAAIVRALALVVEGELAQVILAERAK